jgi:hypothetical protein
MLVLSHRAEALVAFEEQRHADVLSEFGIVSGIQSAYADDNLVRGIALLRTGRAPEALAAFGQRTLYFPEESPDRRGWILNTILSSYWTGIAFEQQHEAGKAIDAYTLFLKLWRDADKDLPAVIDARQRLHTLRGNADTPRQR